MKKIFLSIIFVSFFSPFFAFSAVDCGLTGNVNDRQLHCLQSINDELNIIKQLNATSSSSSLPIDSISYWELELNQGQNIIGLYMSYLIYSPFTLFGFLFLLIFFIIVMFVRFRI